MPVCSAVWPEPPVSPMPADPRPPADIPPVAKLPPDIADMADISPMDVDIDPPIGADIVEPIGLIDVPIGLPIGFPAGVPIGVAPGAFRFLEGEGLDCG